MSLMSNLMARPTVCPGAAIGPDGLCPHCGRRARFEAQFGKVVHVRGRIAGVSPFRREPRPTRPTHRRCPDCAAPLQFVGGAWRCPWTTSTRRRAADGVVACDWPYRDMERRGAA